jgi:3-oxoacyl-[acyl-carrier protein] reductase
MSSARLARSTGMTNSFLFGKNAIVYGAAGGLGRHVARTFAAEGATVHLVGRTRAPLEALAAEIGAAARVAVLDAASDRASAITGTVVNATCGLLAG